MNALLLGFYRFAIMPIAVAFLPLAALFNKKLRLGLRLRRGRYEGFPPEISPIWIHAASGEFEYAKSVIRELKKRAPQTPILVTYFSPTFAQTVASCPGVDRAMPLPLDLPGPCATFLRKMHPRLLLVARTDLWPEMLERCQQAKVPVIVFSFTQKPFRSHFKKFFMGFMLHWVQRIYCVSERDRENLLALTLTSQVEVLGDSRYDQVHFRLAHPKHLPAILRPEHPCLVAGSTWPEDEAVLLPALTPLLHDRCLQLILVPHEPTPEHLRILQRQLASQGLTTVLFSHGVWAGEAVLLVDQVGVLAELYALGNLAFVGGSFRKSVHSVMEALSAGAVTLVGPQHLNNREALDFRSLGFNGWPGLRVVANAQELRQEVEDVLRAPTRARIFGQELKLEVERRMGSSQRLVDAITDLL